MRSRAFCAVALGVVLLSGLEGSASPSPPPGFLNAFSWRMPDDRFGGFSGLELAGNGIDFIAISDRGAFTLGQISRDETGRITQVSAAPMRLLLGNGTQPLQPKRADSEGLALAEDGTVYISFEGAARVLRYRDIAGSAENLPEAAAFRTMQPNSALEALAIGPDGSLYTLPERSGGNDTPFPVYRLQGETWDVPFRMTRKPGFLPVAADFGPDGMLYVLERDFRGLSGFASRLRRLDPDARDTAEGETLLETPVGLHDNLEGLSIWRDTEGRLVASMVSDDNFNLFLRTEIVKYHLPD